MNHAASIVTRAASLARRVAQGAESASRRGAFTWVAWLLAPALLFCALAAFTRVPEELLAPNGYEASVRFYDREGGLLREVRADDAARARWVALDEVGPYPAMAILAAEDRRFRLHAGVDPIAVARAAASDVASRRIVSGASTLTMQLARVVRPHRRTLLGKVYEAALALRIEESLTKDQILEQYLNRAPFGGGVRGIDAASHAYFDKAPRDLSLAEAATLAALPRGPGVYALERHPDRALKRRDRILARMRDAGVIEEDAFLRAQAEPLRLHAQGGSFGAPHAVQAILDGRVGPGPFRGRASSVTTTIDRELQGEVETLAAATLRPLARRHVTSASVVVVDNATGEVLAYVGSPDFDDAAQGGQNDGARALRQPGSTLKPFVYGLAMDRTGMTAATLLPDVELHIDTPSGSFSPHDYDERFHGPVRLREALANSYNVPAVWTAAQLGEGPVLDQLRRVGFTSLREAPEFYGPALALGDGEVSLLELAHAYAALAGGGIARPLRFVREAKGIHGEALVVDRGADERRVVPHDVAVVLTDILADKEARVASFGERSVLELPFPVAAKTGTSKGFRDNWTVGFTHEVTVAVWVGNFDGSPMEGVSGITGAGPLFHGAMEAAMRIRLRGAEPAPLVDPAGTALARVVVCSLSGGAPGHACHHTIEEWIPEGRDLAPCTLHEIVRLDRRNGLRAGASCPSAFVEERAFEVFPPNLASWAHAARRDLAPEEGSPLCPPDAARGALRRAVRVGYPHDGAAFLLDASRARAEQVLAVRLEVPSGTREAALLVDGSVVARVGAPYVARWPLTQGTHVLVAEARGGEASDPVRVVVE